MGKFPTRLQCLALYSSLLMFLTGVNSLSRFAPQSGDISETLEENPLEESFGDDEYSTSSRKSKLFPYFLIKFPNEACSDGNGTNGVCCSSKECLTNGGSSVGSCAKGFGTCCKFTRTCGEDNGRVFVRENSTVIHGFANSTCMFVLPKRANICQVRLDFTHFQYGTGLPTGKCNGGVSITGAHNLEGQPLNLCGNMADQHLYLTYGSADKIVISSLGSSQNSDSYSIKVTYIRCRSSLEVPRHCTQFYSAKEGEIKSFNFPQQQLNNQDYTACFADLRNSRSSRQMGGGGSSKMEWTTCGSGVDNFLISGKKDDGPVTNPNACTTDYVQVFGGNRQCGNSFAQSPVSPPYLLRVRFDDVESTTRSDHAMIVSLPDEATCESLSTPDTTTCTDTANPGTCVCTTPKTSGTLKDEGNTGFCLKYKIVP